jgi:hypothetical protein
MTKLPLYHNFLLPSEGHSKLSSHPELRSVKKTTVHNEVRVTSCRNTDIEAQRSLNDGKDSRNMFVDKNVFIEKGNEQQSNAIFSCDDEVRNFNVTIKG